MTLKQAHEIIDKYKDWNTVDNLPEKTMKVRWLCADGVEDIGIYFHDTGNFAGWDLSSLEEITHWIPLSDIP